MNTILHMFLLAIRIGLVDVDREGDTGLDNRERLQENLAVGMTGQSQLVKLDESYICGSLQHCSLCYYHNNAFVD